MQIGEFNANISREMSAVFDSGVPAEVERRHKEFVTVAPTALFDDLVQAAGQRGQEVLARHRAASEQHEQETAA